MGALAVVIGAVGGGAPLWRGALIGFGIVYVWLFACGILLSPRSAARRAMRERTESKYSFTATALSFEGGASKHRVGWTDFRSLDRLGALSMLSTKSGLTYMIPDRAFESRIDLDKFLALASAKIGAVDAPPAPPVDAADDAERPEPALTRLLSKRRS
jgi:hypothetical protein